MILKAKLVAGIIILKSTGRPIWDTDSDGMSDQRETENGFNPKNNKDGIDDKNGNGYADLEEYLNSLVSVQKQATLFHNFRNPNEIK